MLGPITFAILHELNRPNPYPFLFLLFVLNVLYGDYNYSMILSSIPQPSSYTINIIGILIAFYSIYKVIFDFVNFKAFDNKFYRIYKIL